MQLLSHRRNIWVVERGPTRQSNLSSSVYVVEYVSSFFKTFTQLHSTFFACLAESLKTVLSAAYSAWSYTDDCSIKRGATPLLLLYNVALLLVFLECFNSSGRRPAVKYERGGSMYYPMDALIYLLILVLNLGEGQEGIVVFHLCISIYSVG